MTIAKIIRLIIPLYAIITLLPSCYYDKEETLYPFKACDTTNVTYSQTVAPIIATNCNTCHSGQNPTGKINLDSWPSLTVSVNNGKLVPAIEHTGPFPMPQGGSKLSDCDISRIKKWISNGAPDN
ncbi:MAG: cytochrome c [Bacteroidetes bacterium]|nr:cytochrome c [Bacteroidota bacterium]